MQLYVYFDTEVDASTMEKSLDLDWHPGDEGDNDQQRRSVDPVVVESRQCIKENKVGYCCRLADPVDINTTCSRK